MHHADGAVFVDPVGFRADLRNELARFNMECAHTWFMLQNLAILLLTPAYVGGAIAEERERGTLELLFTSALYNREIVLGKLAARMLHLGAFLLAGLPAFSLMLVWGGLDVPFLLANWINSVLLLLAASSMCLMFSTTPLRATTCVIVSYALVLPGGFCCMSGWQEALQNAFLNGAGLAEPQLLILFAITYGLLIPGCVLISIQALRPPDWPPVLMLPPPERTPKGAAPAMNAPAAALPPMLLLSAASALNEVELRRPVLPPVRDAALLWKECYTGGRSLLHVPEVLLMGGTILCCVLPLVVLITINQATQAHLAARGEFLKVLAGAWGELLRGTYGLFLCCYVIGVAFRAAACVVRERQTQTLDMLLTIPAERREILFAKWAGAVQGLAVARAAGGRSADRPRDRRVPPVQLLLSASFALAVDSLPV